MVAARELGARLLIDEVDPRVVLGVVYVVSRRDYKSGPAVSSSVWA